MPVVLTLVHQQMFCFPHPLREFEPERVLVHASAILKQRIANSAEQSEFGCFGRNAV